MTVSVDPAQFTETIKSLEILRGNIDQLFLMLMGSIIFCEYLKPFFHKIRSLDKFCAWLWNLKVLLQQITSAVKTVRYSYFVWRLQANV